MGSDFNFKNFSNDPSDACGGRPPGNFPLTRQTSIYSLTFDELQNAMGGSLGKDFGSMNMDELLKNIWSAEESQTMATATSSGVQESGGLQRQGSLTLPRTLSQRTVDEVWKDMSKEYVINGTSAGATNNVPQRQPTLGEVTLEEFLVKAGVVREDIQVAARVNANGGSLGDLSRSANNSLAIGFQQNRGVGLNNDNTNQISLQSSNLPLNVNGVNSNQAQVQQQQQQIFPNQPNNMGFVTHMPLQSGPGIRGGMLEIGDQGIDSGLMQGGGMGVVGLGGIATGSPANPLSSDGIGKSNGDTSSVSPVPYVFRESVRGRRAGVVVEKVVERRQRRMIKNRESAARSRARKQAYTMELEAEVAKLKEENEELRKKQAEMMEMQKNQVPNLSVALSIDLKITNNLTYLLIACLMTSPCSYLLALWLHENIANIVPSSYGLLIVFTYFASNESDKPVMLLINEITRIKHVPFDLTCTVYTEVFLIFHHLVVLQATEMMNMQQGGKKRCLRRTQTGPW
ncbi:hypothetical protein SADUNF_Sadunf02G0106300 [Salix dunnii]|uniref:BZIP domain-containing protein n=1 Tax=Salix dunnii TaxID=1413687 RepID=A0A835N766_9ROSI|nr:hypothetical protein SADUNF_Sadunf02G0106300 [Salix dunnii]